MKKQTAQNKRHQVAKAAIGHTLGKRRSKPQGFGSVRAVRRRRTATGPVGQMVDFLKGLSTEQFDALRAEALKRMADRKLAGMALESEQFGAMRAGRS